MSVRIAAALLLFAASSGAIASTARQLYEKASPSVVVVVAGAGQAGGPVSLGSGSILSKSGLVLTNFHVVAADGAPAKAIRVFFKPAQLQGSLERDLTDGRDAQLIAADPERDLALLSVPAEAIKAEPLTIAREVAATGEPTVAIGSPEDGGPWTLTTGAISNRLLDHQSIKGNHVYQIETPINPGNSGGALLDAEGRLLGVTSAAVKIGKSGLPAASIQFAIANDVVLAFLATALASRREFRELPDGERGDLLARAGAKVEPLSAVQSGPSCAYAVCRSDEPNALDRLWDDVHHRAGASGATQPMMGGKRVMDGNHTYVGGDVSHTRQEVMNNAMSDGQKEVYGPPPPPGWTEQGPPAKQSARLERLAAVYAVLTPVVAPMMGGKRVMDGNHTYGGAEVSKERQKQLDSAMNEGNTAGSNAGSGSSSGGEKKQSAIAADFTTPARPYRGADMARFLAPAGAPPAVGAEPPAFASVEAAVFAGKFDVALHLAEANPADAPMAAGLRHFVEGGKLAARRNFAAARFYFRKAESSPRLGRLAGYWQCAMTRSEGRDAAADECFAQHGLVEGKPPATAPRP